MSRLCSFRLVCLLCAGALTVISGCAQKQLTAQEAREKYGSPYSRPQLLTRTKTKLPPVPIDPALRDTMFGFETESANVQPASHTRSEQ